MIRQIIAFFIYISCILLFNQCKPNTIVDEFAYKINKQCPVKLTPNITLINTLVINDSLIYNYITDYPAEYLADRKYMELSKESDLYSIVSNPEMKPLIKAKVSFIHRYRSKENELLTEIKYTPNDYLNFQPDKKGDIYSDLMQMVNKNKGMLPICISENTYLIEMKAEKPNILEYTYQITNANVSEGEVVINESAFIDHVKGIGSLRILRDRGVVFRYKFIDKNEVVMNKFEVTPEDYK